MCLCRVSSIQHNQQTPTLSAYLCPLTKFSHSIHCSSFSINFGNLRNLSIQVQFLVRFYYIQALPPPPSLDCMSPYIFTNLSFLYSNHTDFCFSSHTQTSPYPAQSHLSRYYPHPHPTQLRNPRPASYSVTSLLLATDHKRPVYFVKQ